MLKQASKHTKKNKTSKTNLRVCRSSESAAQVTSVRNSVFFSVGVAYVRNSRVRDRIRSRVRGRIRTRVRGRTRVRRRSRCGDRSNRSA